MSPRPVSIQSLVATCYENERPLTGLSGLLDWRFQGAISKQIRAGAVTGKAGECVYLPTTKAGRLYHLILIGCGTADALGKRSGLPPESVRKLENNLSTLRIPQIGLSKSDFGNISDEWVNRNFPSLELRMTQ